MQGHNAAQDKDMTWQQADRVSFFARSLRAHLSGQRDALLFNATCVNWLPSYFNRFHAMAPDKAGLRTGHHVADRLSGRGGLWLHRATRLTEGMPRRRLVLMAFLHCARALAFGAAFGLPVSGLQVGVLFFGAFFMAGVPGTLLRGDPRSGAPGMTGMAIGILAGQQRSRYGLGPLIGGMLADKFAQHGPADCVRRAADFGCRLLCRIVPVRQGCHGARWRSGARAAWRHQNSPLSHARLPSCPFSGVPEHE